jgi:lipoic acid synthetase
VKPRPAWLRKPLRLSPEVLRLRREIGGLGLATVCESARCPNLGECYCAGIATFLILGELCTRDCAFCAIGHGPPGGPDPAEGTRIAAFIRSHSIRFAVLTSVTRDDLEDGGAEHFERVVRDIRGQLPAVGLELLVPDFRGRAGPVERVAGLPIQVFAHNMETVRELYPRVRRGADYERSLEVLRRAVRSRTPGLRVKSGIMVGLGEQPGQLEELFADLAAAGAQILTIGQYLRPTGFNAPVIRYYNPEEFEHLRALAAARGIPTVVAGPYVRSSYLAEQAFLASAPAAAGEV